MGLLCCHTLCKSILRFKGYSEIQLLRFMSGSQQPWTFLVKYRQTPRILGHTPDFTIHRPLQKVGILSTSKYPRIPRIHFHEDPSQDDPEYVQVPQDSDDTSPRASGMILTTQPCSILCLSYYTMMYLGLSQHSAQKCTYKLFWSHESH